MAKSFTFLPIVSVVSEWETTLHATVFSFVGNSPLKIPHVVFALFLKFYSKYTINQLFSLRQRKQLNNSINTTLQSITMLCTTNNDLSLSCSMKGFQWHLFTCRLLLQSSRLLHILNHASFHSQGSCQLNLTRLFITHSTKILLLWLRASHPMDLL